MSVALSAAPAAVTNAVLHVRPWPDPVIDRLGLDPRSAYVERFWLPVLGPSAVWLLRLLADRFDAEPDGFELAVDDTARAIGLGGRGRNSPFARTVVRCCQFHLAHLDAASRLLLVRSKMPPLNRHQLTRLPADRRAEHDQWQRRHAEQPGAAELLDRARRLALSLLELGEDVEAAERQLARWRFHPTMCRDAVAWASRHAGPARATRAEGQATSAASPATTPPPATGPAPTTGRTGG